jgi:hypothetical protein
MILKMEVIRFRETLVNVRTARRYIREDGNFYNGRCKNLEPYKGVQVSSALAYWYFSGRGTRRLLNAFHLDHRVSSQTCWLSLHVLPTWDRLLAKNSASLYRLVCLGVSHKPATWGPKLFQNKFMIPPSRIVYQLLVFVKNALTQNVRC